MTNNTYIVAVSGGVDSVVLLDMLVKKQIVSAPFDKPHNLVVGHFDHGIRTDSTEVGRGVGELAKNYGIPFELGSASLGAGASEAKARESRYNFLRLCCNKYNASAIITAHHQDDVVETILLNLIRGTNWRGLAPMTNSYINNSQIIRPLINCKKSELIKYAKNNSLRWFDDSTNTDQTYLRNYIRHTVLPSALNKDSQFLQKILDINKDVSNLSTDIATMLQKYIVAHITSDINVMTLPRYFLVMLPSSVAYEVLYSIFTTLDINWHPSTQQLNRTWWFVRGARLGKILQVSKTLNVTITKDGVRFKNRAQYATLA